MLFIPQWLIAIANTPMLQRWGMVWRDRFHLWVKGSPSPMQINVLRKLKTGSRTLAQLRIETCEPIYHGMMEDLLEREWIRSYPIIFTTHTMICYQLLESGRRVVDRWDASDVSQKEA